MRRDSAKHAALDKVEPSGRRQRAASLAVRNNYWRASLYPRARAPGRSAKRAPRAASPSPTGARPSRAERLPPPKPEPPAERLPEQPQPLDPLVVVKLLRVAHACAKSAPSQLPGEWDFGSRPRRGDASLRSLICPCGARLRSILAVERHLALGGAECVACTRPGDLSSHALAPPAKISRWLHKYDGGLLPSD